ncbi:MAG: hypothetical protein QOF25_266 [Mycobacterium sp.]|nr:hypothetical protein [Mycobacterium sp.]
MDVFVKRGPAAPPGFFACEVAGLRWLAAAGGGAACARVIGHDETSLTLERLSSVAPDRATAHGFGGRLARTHDAGAAGFGAPPDGWTGPGFFGPLHRPLPMSLTARPTWGGFYAAQRLAPMAELAGPRLGAVNGDVQKVISRCSRGDFDDDDQPARLHGIKEVTDGTLTGLLTLLGLNLKDPLNLAGLAVPSLNVVTAGPTFAALKMLGLDLGWLPSLPNSVANEINGTDYLRLGVDGVLDLVLDKLQKSTLPGASLLIAPLVALIQSITDPLTSHLPDVIDVRVIPTVGVGLGAFAAATAYDKVLAELAAQPGGSAYVGTDPLLGSLTLLPLVLINNPVRPDGGAFARFGPLAALFGINTVNPRTEASNDGTGTPVIGTGVSLGAANLLPILIDATYEYQPLSDLASWPNPFTLANNLAAGPLPTYMLRGLSLDGLTDQILDQVGELVDDSVASGNPLALNVYLTLHSATSPMLEPLYLAADFLNLVGLGPLAQIPMRLANALAPAMSTLTNIGYANVVQNPDGTYTRDFSNAGTETPFLSFADIDYGRVPGDVINQLIGGFTKEFFSANPTPNGPNVLANLLDALLGGGLGGILGGFGLGGLGSSVAPPAATGATAASIPDTNPSFSRLSISGGAEDESATAALDSKTTTEATEDATVKLAAEDATTKPASTEEVVAEKPATEEPVAEKPAAAEEPAAEKPADEGATGPKHAKPDEEPAAGKPAATDSTPKHAKPDEDKQSGTDTTTKDKTPKKDKPALNVVRDSANASSPKDEKTGTPESGKKNKDEAAAASSTGAKSAVASSNAA